MNRYIKLLAILFFVFISLHVSQSSVFAVPACVTIKNCPWDAEHLCRISGTRSYCAQAASDSPICNCPNTTQYIHCLRGVMHTPIAVLELLLPPKVAIATRT